ncbi:MAG: S8 family serine peptidase, partial [Anaerolineae bacterium]|nr:S8 family serine peptidase [Anaerolineae bacterium]
MKRAVTLLLVVILLLGAVPLFSVSAQGEAQSYLVIANGNKLAKGLEAEIVAAGGVVTNVIPEIGVVAVSSSDPNFAVKAAGISGVQYAVMNAKVENVDPVEPVAISATVSNPPFSGDDDFYFDLQWGHDAVNAPEAWAAGVTGAGVRVAVLDTGFDTDHPDLEPNIDFAASKNFVPGETLVYGLADTYSHGTHTAGTVAAADNGFGTIGIAPDATLVLCKVLSDAGSGEFDWILSAIVYAAGEAEADVITMSIGAYFPRTPDANETAALTTALNRAAAYAYSEGAVLIASAGNDGADRDHDKNWLHLPSDTPHILTISATAPIGWATDPENIFLDSPVYYSNYGQSAIDFAAPGGNVEYPGNELCQVGPITHYCYVFDLVF